MSTKRAVWADVIEDLEFMREHGETPARAYGRLIAAETFHGKRTSLRDGLKRRSPELADWFTSESAGDTLSASERIAVMEYEIANEQAFTNRFN